MENAKNKTSAVCILIFIYLAMSCFPVAAGDIGAFIPGKGWVKQGAACDGDSTPLQFIPKTGPDNAPLVDELKKYPRCVHCGMSRTMWHHSRHLVHYNDDLAVGTCSLRCLAVNLSLNIDRGVKNIWAADFADTQKPATLIDAQTAVYLMGSKLKGTMTRNSKMVFPSKEVAEKAMKKSGGKLASFETALTTAFTDMAKDTIMIRTNREKKRKK